MFLKYKDKKRLKVNVWGIPQWSSDSDYGLSFSWPGFSPGWDHRSCRPCNTAKKIKEKGKMKKKKYTHTYTHNTNCELAYTFMDVRTSQVAVVVKNLPASVGDLRDTGPIPGWVRSPGSGHGNPVQYSCLENHMDRGAQQATVHRVTKSQTQLKLLSRHAHTYGYKIVIVIIKKRNRISRLSQRILSYIL